MYSAAIFFRRFLSSSTAASAPSTTPAAKRRRRRPTRCDALFMERFGIDVLEPRRVLAAASLPNVAAESFTFAALAVAAPVSAETDFTTSTTSGAVTIIGYVGTSPIVSIPSTIGGLPVTTIGKHAFSTNTNITSVTIPEGVTEILGPTSEMSRYGAFSKCSALKDVSLPKSLLSIATQTFEFCTSLANITLPPNLTFLGGEAFTGCARLTSIVIPSGITALNGGTFSDCSRLASVVLPNSLTAIADYDFAGCSRLPGISLPSRLSTIGYSAFSDCISLAVITPPASLVTIGGNAFARCSSLPAIAFSKGLVSLGDSAFASCTSLKSASFSDGFATLGDSAFASCVGLKSASFSNGFVSMGAGAFSDCIALTNVSLSSTLVSLGSNAFKNCTSLSFAALPSSLTNFGSYAFYGCSSLASVTIQNGVNYIPTGAFQNCKNLTLVTLPASIDTIQGGGREGSEQGAFSGCSSLTTIIIPAKVDTLGDYAFSNCPALTGAYFLGNAPSLKLGTGIFTGDNVATVYYINGTTGWTGTFAGRPTSAINAGVPSAPSNVVATAGNARATLSWSPPTLTGGLPLADYAIQYSVVGSNVWTPWAHDSSTATTATVTGLQNNQSYLFQVAAVNGVGAGPVAVTAQAIFLPPSSPGVPTGLSAKAANASAFLSWIAPVYNGGAAITDYSIQYSTNSGSLWQDFAHAASTATSATVTGLPNGTSVIFRVAALNSVSRGDYSLASVPVTPVVFPSLSITPAKPVLMIGEATTFTFQLSAPSTTFTTEDVYPIGGTTSGFTAISSTKYIATFTPTAGAAYSYVAVYDRTFTDLNGVANISRDGAVVSSVTVDGIAPTAMLTPSTSVVGIGGSVLFTISLSKPSQNFTAADVYTVGGTVSQFQALSPTTYTCAWAPSSDTTLGYVVVYDNTFTDSAGNGNISPNGYLISFVASDLVAPTITIAPQKNPVRAGETAIFTLTLSEPSTTFTAANVYTVGGTVSEFTAVSSSVYSCAWTPNAGVESGYIVVYDNTFTDLGGNGNASTGGYVLSSVAVDSIAPTVSIAPTKAVLKGGERVIYNLTLSEPSRDFKAANIFAVGGTLSGFTALSSTRYQITFAPAATAAYRYVTVYDTTFTDLAGNGNISANGHVLSSVKVDTVAPTVAVSWSTATLKMGETATVTFRLTEPSTNFTESALRSSGGTLSRFTRLNSSTYTALFTPFAKTTITGWVLVWDNQFTDEAGNYNRSTGASARYGYEIANVSIDTVRRR
jgi:hypothetical protein